MFFFLTEIKVDDKRTAFESKKVAAHAYASKILKFFTRERTIHFKTRIKILN